MNGTDRITKTAARSEAEEFLDLAVTLGYRLLSEGAEISRVEEAVTRLMQA